MSLALVPSSPLVPMRPGRAQNGPRPLVPMRIGRIGTGRVLVRWKDSTRPVDSYLIPVVRDLAESSDERRAARLAAAAFPGSTLVEDGP